ncbi:MAG: DUF4157 domain-containing protein [Vicinamibacterales bacterium]|jgi:hypothetical protein|nr:DUF4157 domain-containing protein [Vicinamibacterales bacterium]
MKRQCDGPLRRGEPDEKRPTLQPSATPVEQLQGQVGNRAVRDLIRSSRGRPLEPGARTELESKVGADLSGVLLHDDEPSAALARNLRARAVTYGQDVWFGDGQLDPSGSDGRRLLVHELIHTVQHGAARWTGSSVPLSRRTSGAERAADAGARTVAAGGHLQPGTVPTSPPVLARDELGTEYIPVELDIGFDPDVGAPEPPDPIPEELGPTPLTSPGKAPVRPAVSHAAPTVVWVDLEASRADVAGWLLGRRSQVHGFRDATEREAAPARSSSAASGRRPIVVKEPKALSLAARRFIVPLLERALAAEIRFFIHHIKETPIRKTHELTKRLHRWAQWSEFTDMSGVSFFERLVRKLDATTLTDENVVFADETKSALDWLLAATDPAYDEQIPFDDLA